MVLFPQTIECAACTSARLIYTAASPIPATQPNVNAGPNVIPGPGYAPPITEFMSFPTMYSPGIASPSKLIARANSSVLIPHAVPISPAKIQTAYKGGLTTGPRHGLGSCAGAHRTRL